MTAADGLLALAGSTARAVADVLRGLLPDGVEVGPAEVVPAGASPLAGVAVPGVAADVATTAGASGRHLFVTTAAGARVLAAAMTGAEPDPRPHPLDERERATAAEAMTRVLATAAGAAGAVLGQDVDVPAPALRELLTAEDALALDSGAAFATRVDLTLAGQPCRLVHLASRAFVVEVTRALEERVEAPAAPERDLLLSGVNLRVSVEIGRATMPLARAVGLPAGEVVELDRAADEPVDLLVNGRRFATGRLVLVDDEWAVRVEEVLLDVHPRRAAAATPIDRS